MEKYKLYPTSLMTEIADAIRDKNKTTDKIVVRDIPVTVEEIKTGDNLAGGEQIGSITEYYAEEIGVAGFLSLPNRTTAPNKNQKVYRFPNLKAITEHGFLYNNFNVTGVYMPELEAISGDYAMGNMYAGTASTTPTVSTISMRKLKIVTGAYFVDATPISNVNLPSLETAAGVGVTQVTRINMPKLKQIATADTATYASFKYCGPDALDLPELQTVGGGFFMQVASDLGKTGYKTIPAGSEINLPKLKHVGNGFFDYQWRIDMLSLPALEETAGTSFMSGCRDLQVLDIGANATKALTVTTNTYFLYASNNLDTLIIRNPGVTVLPYNVGTQNILKNSKILTSSTEGFIYVPAAYVNAYKANARWAPVANKIRAIEDYPDVTALF